MKKSLFEKAKKTSTVKAAKGKDEKARVRVEDPSFFDKVARLEVLNEQMKAAKAKADILSDELRDIAKAEWAKLYEKMGKNPDSIIVEAVNAVDDTAQLMFVPMDKYITINAERAEALREEFGEEIVEEKTTFSFDNDMIEKYGEVLSRLIEESDEIDEKDKEKIIKATTSFSVAKGTIDNFKKYGDVETMIESVKPVMSLKNIEVIKG